MIEQVFSNKLNSLRVGDNRNKCQRIYYLNTLKYQNQHGPLQDYTGVTAALCYIKLR
jgi:hypothetical protein